MASYLVAKVNTVTKSYELKTSEPTKPYLRVSNSYLPLSSGNTTTGLQIKANNNVCGIVESRSTTINKTSTINWWYIKTSTTIGTGILDEQTIKKIYNVDLHGSSSITYISNNNNIGYATISVFQNGNTSRTFDYFEASNTRTNQVCVTIKAPYTSTMIGTSMSLSYARSIYNSKIVTTSYYTVYFNTMIRRDLFTQTLISSITLIYTSPVGISSTYTSSKSNNTYKNASTKLYTVTTSTN